MVGGEEDEEEWNGGKERDGQQKRMSQAMRGRTGRIDNVVRTSETVHNFDLVYGVY